MFGCPLYIWGIWTYGVSKHGHVPPIYFKALIYVWTSLICLDTPICSDAPQCASEHMGVSKHMGHSNLWGCPNLWGIKHMGVSKPMGHPNIWGIQTYGDIQTYRGHMNIGDIWTHPKSDSPLWLPLSRGNIYDIKNKYPIKTCWTYGGCPNVWGCMNIGGHKDTTKSDIPPWLTLR